MITDIRVQLILMGIVVFIVTSLFTPDRYGRYTGALLATAGSLLLLAAAANLPGYFEPLPTGAAAAGNFWVKVDAFCKQSGSLPSIVGGAYLLAGLIWAVSHFTLYARRLGQMYVLERDCWMQEHELASLEGLSSDLRTDFQKVLEKVKAKMLYTGDFPLRPFQQKRMFVGNVLLWPATLAFYLLSDFAMDAARYIWFAVRGYVQRRWEHGMAEYLADDALCKSFLSNVKA